MDHVLHLICFSLCNGYEGNTVPLVGGGGAGGAGYYGGGGGQETLSLISSVYPCISSYTVCDVHVEFLCCCLCILLLPSSPYSMLC
jgi:hypothetical protein